MKLLALRGAKRLDAFQMTALTGPISFAVLLPFALWADAGTLSHALEVEPHLTLGFLLGSCLLAVLYNITIFHSLRTLSTVGTAVLGNVKVVLLMALSAIILGELRSWSHAQLAGCVVVFGASGWYSRLKLMKSNGGGREAQAGSSDCSALLQQWTRHARLRLYSRHVSRTEDE